MENSYNEFKLFKEYPTFPIGRKLNEVCIFSYEHHKRHINGANIEPLKYSSFITSGVMSSDEERGIISIFFSDAGTDTHIARYVLPKEILATGFGCKVSLKNWHIIKYFAIGFNVNGIFYHIKIVHPVLDRESVYYFSLFDLIYLIQNKWQAQEQMFVKDIKFFVKGSGEYGGGELELHELCIFNEMQRDFTLYMNNENISFKGLTKCLISNFSISCELEQIIFDYQSAVYPAADEHVDAFMSGNGLGVSKNKVINWDIFDKIPNVINESITFRYAWHALYPVCILLKKAYKTGAPKYICAARDFINNWIEENVFSPSNDIKYAWYDHGTAERAIILVQMWYLGIKYEFDTRFMKRLLYVIYLHSQLLSSAAFYASHQNYKYHNHALFQDLALLFLSLAIPEFSASGYWFETAVNRMKDQLDHLICDDENYAVFVENSTGYHDGVLTIIKLFSELMRYANLENENIKLYSKMKSFSEIIKYPGTKRMPAIGDTFRVGNHNNNSLISSDEFKGFIFLKKAGYAIAKGMHKGVPFQFTMTASSLNKTHKHCDNLSFTLFFDNLEWLIDPSFYSHQYTEALPKYLRGPLAHNSLVIDGADYSIEPGLAELYQHKNPSGSNYFGITGVHYSYKDMQINRMVKGRLDKLYLEFIDKISSNNTNVNSYMMLHCGENIDANILESELVLSSKMSRYLMKIKLPSDTNEIFFGINDKNRIFGWAACGFQEAVPVYTIRCLVHQNKELKWSIAIDD